MWPVKNHHVVGHGPVAAAQRLRSFAAVLISLLLVGVLGSACTGSPSDSKSPNQTAYRIGSLNWASSISNNPYAASPTPYLNLILLNLAVTSAWGRPGDNPYYPEMAESWKVDKNAITFNLRQAAKWQDGKPFTSKDVVTSLLVAGANYNSVWAGISSVEAPDDHTVKVNLQSWVVPDNQLESLLKISIVSDAQFGEFIPSSGFDKTLKSYWDIYNILKPTAASIKNASDSPAGKTMADASAKVAKFNPDTLIGNGPYTIKSANVSGVLYEKWDGFWDADKITAPFIQVTPMNSATEFAAIMGGTIDQESDSLFTNPQADQMNATGYAHYGVIPSPVQQMSLIFNFSHYPFNLLPVRQAFAHIIDRKDLSIRGSGGGTRIQSPPVDTPDGINYSHAEQYITKEQFAQLNHYPIDLGKAASLLTGAGFTKKNGKWYTPKGGLFKFTISEPGGIAQYVQDGLVLAGYLKNFGFDVTVENVDQGTWGAKMLAGDFDLTQNFMDWGQKRNPMADFAAGFGELSPPSYNYPISYSGSGPCTCAIGIGPDANVPGLGKVNIAAELNREVQQAPPETWAKYTWAWAQWINQNLPILGLYDNAFHTIYQTQRYDNFPAQSEKWLWTPLSGANYVVLWMQNGYIKLK